MATIPASENEFPEVKFAEGAAPSTPASGLVIAYAKSDGLLYSKDDAGAESPLSAAGHIADTSDAHDASAISVLDSGANFTGTDVEAVLAELQDNIDAISAGSGIPGGTSNPGSPSTGDTFFRTDLGHIIYYDGTRWLSTQTFTCQMIPRSGVTSTTGVGDMGPTSIAATSSGILRVHVPSVLGASNLWLVNYKVGFQVGGGGTALGASHKWVGVVAGLDSASASTGTVATVNIDSGSSSVWREITVAIGAAMAAGTMLYLIGWTKTGTPGVLTTGETLTYRLIVT